MTELLEKKVNTPIRDRSISKKNRPIEACLSYLNYTGVRPVSYAFEPPKGASWENCTYDLKSVEIHDARMAKVPPSLQREGYQLIHTPSHVKNFYDDEEIRRVYYPEVEELALETTGGKAGYVFDHLIRRKDSSSSAMSFGRNVSGKFPSANGRIHNDYSESSGLVRLEKVIPDPDERCKIRRYCIVNIWRSISGPIVDTPLAICDSRTVSTHDLVVSDVLYPNRTGEVFLFRYSETHRWSYFSRMNSDEALVFKQYDSQLSGVSRFTPHAAFDHPYCPVGAPPRESIEIRCLVVY